MAKSTSKRAREKARAQQNTQGIVLAVIALVAVVAAGIVIFVSSRTTQTPTSASGKGAYAAIPQTTTADGAPILGSPDAKITVLEYADFSCPHCLEYHPTIVHLIDQYVRTGKARLIFRPMTFVGKQYSVVAAKAALCASKQNGFWEMSDALFDMQQTQGLNGFNPDTLRTTATDLGLDGAAVQACMLGTDGDTTLAESDRLFTSMGAGGTPSMLYSTDGTTFNWFKDDNGQDAKGGPAANVIDQVIDRANASKS